MISPFTDPVIIVSLFANRNPVPEVFFPVEMFDIKKINQMRETPLPPDFEIFSTVKKNTKYLSWYYIILVVLK